MVTRKVAAMCRSRALFVLSLSISVFVSQAKADQLKLKDGRLLLGQIVSESQTSITFASKVGDRTIVERYQRTQIEKILRELKGVHDPFGNEEEEGSTEKGSEADAIRVKARRVVFLFDTSGSMSLGNRLVRARNKAKKILQGYSAETRLQVYAFDGVVQALQRDYRNVLKTNGKDFLKALSRLSVNAQGKTDFEKALKQTLRVRPSEIHLFTDGVSRVEAGETGKKLRSKLLKMLAGGVKVHVHMFQQGKLGWLGNEPLEKSRVLFQDLAQITGGDFSVEPSNVEKRNKDFKLEIEVLFDNRPVESLEIGKKYSVRLKLAEPKTSKIIAEYLTVLPLLARSVDRQGKDVLRRLTIPLKQGKFGVTSQFQVKVVGAKNSSAGTPGYLGAAPGGKVAFFFDALGEWINYEIKVKK